MIVPIVAPSVGQLIILYANWHWIFILLGVTATILFVWALLRLKESLPPEERLPLSVSSVLDGFKTVLTNRITWPTLPLASPLSRSSAILAAIFIGSPYRGLSALAETSSPTQRQSPKTDQPVRAASISSATAPSCELPTLFKPGDQTAIEAMPGATAKMPPPTPLLPGRPT